jgi:hypothetical protein
MRRLFLPLCILLFPPALGADWYRSDALGRAGQAVENPVPEDEEYLLNRTDTAGGLRDELYFEGRLISTSTSRELPEGEREEEIVEGGERRLTIYRDGLPLREEIQRDGGPVRVFRYGWSSRRLGFLELSGGGGLLYRQEYRRDPAGRLRTLLRFEGDGAVKVLHFTYEGGGLSETWVGDFDAGLQTFYEGPDLLAEYRIEGLEPVARIVRESAGNGWAELSYNAENELISRTVISEEGRVLRETSYSGGKVGRDKEYIYRDGLLVEQITRSPGRLERRRFFYTGDELQREELYVNRRLVRLIEYEGENRLEEYYRRDSIVIRRRYEGDELIEEERFEEP